MDGLGEEGKWGWQADGSYILDGDAGEQDALDKLLRKSAAWHAYNPNHDDKGRFSESDSSGGGSADTPHGNAKLIAEIPPYVDKFGEKPTDNAHAEFRHDVWMKERQAVEAYLRGNKLEASASHGDYRVDVVQGRFIYVKQGDPYPAPAGQHMGFWDPDLGEIGVSREAYGKMSHAEKAGADAKVQVTKYAPSEFQQLRDEFWGKTTKSSAAYVGYNPNHDDKGRFSESDGGGGGQEFANGKTSNGASINVKRPDLDTQEQLARRGATEVGAVRLCGVEAYGDGMRVEASMRGDGDVLKVKGTVFDEHDKQMGLFERTLDFSRRVIVNDNIRLREDAPAGLGTRILAAQVEEATKGVRWDHIEALADRAPGTNGYYTWPRLGFDGDMPDIQQLRYEYREILGKPYPRRLSQMMTTPRERKLWQQWGEPVQVKFNLNEGSKSRKVLDAYMKEKGYTATATKPATHGKDGAPVLTEEDEAILDRIWKRVMGKQQQAHVAYNENHDSLGRFSESDGGDGGGSDARPPPADSTLHVRGNTVLGETANGAKVHALVNDTEAEKALANWGIDEVSALRLCGVEAYGKGMRVEASIYSVPYLRYGTKTWDHPKVGITGTVSDRRGKLGEFYRVLDYEHSTIENKEIRLQGRAPEGLGTRVLAAEVAEAQAVGFDKIEARAVRQDTGDGMNGYYTWPRLGFDGSVYPNYSFGEAAQKQGWKDPPKTLHEVMSRPGGKELWRKYGDSVDVSFDTRPGSTSRQVLDAYMKEKGYTAAVKKPAPTHGEDGAPILTPEDEAILDRIWARVLGKGGQAYAHACLEARRRAEAKAPWWHGKQQHTWWRAFNPNHDERGRFAESDGAGGGAPSDAPGHPTPAQGLLTGADTEVVPIIEKVAAELNYPRDQIAYFNSTGPEYNLEGYRFNAAGTCSLENKYITIYSAKGLTGGDVKAILAHEIEHARYQTVLDDFEREKKELSDHDTAVLDKSHNWRDPELWMRVDDTIRDEEIAARFPTYAALYGVNHGRPFDGDKMRKDDGVTEYSRMWWQHAETTTKTVDYKAAMHETMAELAKIKYLGGATTVRDTDFQLRLKGASPSWRKYFQTIDKLADKKFGKKKSAKAALDSLDRYLSYNMNHDERGRFSESDGGGGGGGGGAGNTPESAGQVNAGAAPPEVQGEGTAPSIEVTGLGHVKLLQGSALQYSDAATVLHQAGWLTPDENVDAITRGRDAAWFPGGSEKSFQRDHPDGIEGFKTWAEWRDHVVGNWQQAVDGSQVAIQVPGSVLAKIDKDGVLNQFESNRSGGLKDFEERAKMEYKAFGIAPDAPPSERPVYGYLVDRANPLDHVRNIINDNSNLEQYGQVTLVLKDSSVRDKTTVSTADSLDLQSVMRPAKIDNVDVLSMSPYRVATDAENRQRYGAPDNIKGYTKGGMLFAEAQIHASVTFKDVEKIIAPWTASSAATRSKIEKFAKKHGIEVKWYEIGNE